MRGRRFLHAQKILKVEIGQLLRAGLLNQKMGTVEVLKLDADAITLHVRLNEEPPPPFTIKTFFGPAPTEGLAAHFTNGYQLRNKRYPFDECFPS